MEKVTKLEKVILNFSEFYAIDKKIFRYLLHKRKIEYFKNYFICQELNLVVNYLSNGKYEICAPIEILSMIVDFIENDLYKSQ